MMLNRACPICGELIIYDTYFDRYKDGGKVIHIRTKRKTDMLYHRACIEAAQKAQKPMKNIQLSERSTDE